MDNKGIISKEEWREFCSDCVLLGEFSKYVWQEKEEFECSVKISNYKEVIHADMYLKAELLSMTECIWSEEIKIKELFVGMNSHLSILDDTKLDPIVQMIDNFERNHLLGLVYELKIEESSILVCTSPLKNIENSSPAQRLNYSLIKYILSDDFKPDQCINNINYFKKIFS